MGLTEEVARRLGMKVVCGHYDMGKNGKSIIAREESGFIRLVFDAYAHTLVGAQIMCARATDMIETWISGMRRSPANANRCRVLSTLAARKASRRPLGTP